MVSLFSLNLNCGLILHMLTYIVSNCFLWFKNSAFKINSGNSPDINISQEVKKSIFVPIVEFLASAPK